MNSGITVDNTGTGRLVDSSSFQNETFFITGCSGFLGKVVLEKILRSFSCRQVYVLLREKKGKSITDRFISEILDSPIFETLRGRMGNDFDEWMKRSVIPVSGDLLEAGIALSKTDREKLTSRVSVIIHAGASVDFDLPLDDATKINIDGSLEILSLAKSCVNLKALVHVSTCYVNSHLRGFVKEQLYPSPFDVEETYKMIKQSSQDFLRDNKKSIIKEWPNTYTFTKYLTEQLLVKECGRVPLIICRPSIIAAALNEPVPGWTDSISAATAVYLAIGLGILPPLPGSVWNVADVIPVDLCANMILLAAACTVAGNKTITSSVPIVHCGTSSSDQPMTWFASSDTITDAFAEHPPPNQLMVRQVVFCKERQKLERETFLRSKLPQYLLSLIEKWSIGKSNVAGRARKALAMGDRIVDVFGHFTENEWIFDSNFVRKFSPLVDPECLNLDSNNIDWHQYMHLVCYGMRKYCFGNPLAELPMNASLKGDVLHRSTVWRLSERDEVPRRSRARDLRWVWKGVPMDYDVPSVSRIEKGVLNTVQPDQSEKRLTTSIIRSLECRFDNSTVRFFGYTLQKLFSTMFERIDVNEDMLRTIRNLQHAKPQCPILLVPTHRSYLDFLMLSFILFAYHIKVPFIVAGEDFKKIPGVNSILRNSGAFFMKRKLDAIKDPLYVSVFKAYFQQVIQDHKMVEFFVEGTRSRSGFTLTNKNGLLSFALELIDDGKVQDMYLVPVAINYERVLEAETFPHELLGGRKEKESLARIMKAVSVLRTNYGRAHIVFDTPVSVNELKDSCSLVGGIGTYITDRLNSNLVIMSTHAVATVLLANRQSSISTEEIQSQVESLRDYLRDNHYPYCLPTQGTCAYSVNKCISSHFKDILQIDGDKVLVPQKDYEVLLLSYYRNHLLGSLAVQSMIVAVLGSTTAATSEVVANEVLAVADLLGPPFRTSSQRVEETLAKMIAAKVITLHNFGGWIQLNQEHGYIINLLLSLVTPFLDSLWATLNVLRLNPNDRSHQSLAVLVQSFTRSESTHLECTSLEVIRLQIHALISRGTHPETEGVDGLVTRVSRLRRMPAESSIQPSATDILKSPNVHLSRM